MQQLRTCAAGVSLGYINIENPDILPNMYLLVPLVDIHPWYNMVHSAGLSYDNFARSGNVYRFRLRPYGYPKISYMFAALLLSLTVYL